MKLEKQVCSLELSKKLKELGVKQESLFEYRKFDGGKDFFWSKPLLVGKIPDKLGCANVGFGKVSAFTVAELGELLINNTPKKIMDTSPTYDGLHKSWYFETVYNGENWETEWIDKKIRTEANARAKMLVYLLENNLTNLNQ